MFKNVKIPSFVSIISSVALTTSVPISLFECTDFWIASQKKTLLHSCSLFVTYLTGQNKSVLSLSSCLGFRHELFAQLTEKTTLAICTYHWQNLVFHCYIWIFPKSTFILTLLTISLRLRNHIVTENMQLLADLVPKIRHKCTLFIASIFWCCSTGNT